MFERYYSITAYEVDVRNREKGINGVPLKELTDFSLYHDRTILVSTFVDSIRKRQNDSHRLIELFNNEDVGEIEGMKVLRLELRYGGNNGSYFSVFQKNKELKFDPNDKIVRNYTVYFFLSKDRAYMVTLRIGTCSCKTAIETEFRHIIDMGNIVVSFFPISNNEYIMKHYNDCSFSSISFDTIYKIDDGDLAKGQVVKKDTFSTVNISLESEKTRRMFNLHNLVDVFTGTVKSELLSKMKNQIDENQYEIDEDSIKVEIGLNGTKRSVFLSSLSNLMYDVDITNQIETTDDGSLDYGSLDEVVFGYMRGIIKNGK